MSKPNMKLTLTSLAASACSSTPVIVRHTHDLLRLVVFLSAPGPTHDVLRAFGPASGPGRRQQRQKDPPVGRRMPAPDPSARGGGRDPCHQLGASQLPELEVQMQLGVMPSGWLLFYANSVLKLDVACRLERGRTRSLAIS